jgi:hypothetical protein
MLCTVHMLTLSATYAVLQLHSHTQAFAFSRWRLIVLNLEGVLAKATALPELVSVPDELLESLRLLSEEPVNVSTLLQQLAVYYVKMLDNKTAYSAVPHNVAVVNANSSRLTVSRS